MICRCPKCLPRLLELQAWRWFIVSLCMRRAVELGESACIDLPPAVIASGVNN